MPTIELWYSESLADAKGTSKKLAAAAAAAIGKDVSQFLVKVEDNAALTVGASDKPCFFMRVSSLGSSGNSSNPSVVQALTKFVEEELSVDSENGYIFLFDPGRPNVAQAGKLYG